MAADDYTDPRVRMQQRLRGVQGMQPTRPAGAPTGPALRQTIDAASQANTAAMQERLRALQGPRPQPGAAARAGIADLSATNTAALRERLQATQGPRQVAATTIDAARPNIGAVAPKTPPTAYSRGQALGQLVKPIADRLPSVGAPSAYGAGRVAGAAVRALPVAAGAAAPYLENIDLYGNDSPMTAGQKGKMLLRDTVRAAGGLGGGAAGAAVGSAAGPVGSIAGGIGGYFLGQEAFDRAAGDVRRGVNAVNGALGGDPNYFTGTDQDIAAARQTMYRNENYGNEGRRQVPPAATDPSAPPTTIEAGASMAGAGRGVVNPAGVTPTAQRAPSGGGGLQRPRKAAAASIDQPAQPIASVAGPSGVRFASFGSSVDGDPYSGMQAQLADGTVVRGREALPLIEAFRREQDSGPAQPVEILRGGMAPSVAIPTGNAASPYLEGPTAALGNDRGAGFLKAANAGTIEAAAPVQAKTAQELAVEQQRGQNSATSAGISAGPGFAGVQQRREEAAAELAFKEKTAQRPVVVPGGQEVQMIDGLPVTTTKPARVYNPNTSTFINETPAAAAPDITTDPRALAIKQRLASGAITREAAAKQLQALGY